MQLGFLNYNKRTQIVEVDDEHLNPYAHQNQHTKSNSTLAYEKIKKNGVLKTQKMIILDCLYQHPKGLTLNQISDITGIIQKSTITGRFGDIRKDGIKIYDYNGAWSLHEHYGQI